MAMNLTRRSFIASLLGLPAAVKGMLAMPKLKPEPLGLAFDKKAFSMAAVDLPTPVPLTPWQVLDRRVRDYIDEHGVRVGDIFSVRDGERRMVVLNPHTLKPAYIMSEFGTPIFHDRLFTRIIDEDGEPAYWPHVILEGKYANTGFEEFVLR